MDNYSRQDEQERRRELLSHLRNGRIADVPLWLLLDPWYSTRPFVGLVARYDRRIQIFGSHASMFEVMKVMALVAAFGVPLARLFGVILDLSWMAAVSTWVDSNLAAIPSIYWPQALFNLSLVYLVGAVAVALLTFLAMNLLGRLSYTRDALSFDLNGLYYSLDDGVRYVSWRNVMAAESRCPCWIRVRLGDGSLLRMHVPKADCDWLVQTIKHLLRYHQGDLHGIIPIGDPASSIEPRLEEVCDGP